MVARHTTRVTVSQYTTLVDTVRNIYHTVWSNFEISDMDFWRGPAYTAFFEYLDSTGGFYYEVCAYILGPYPVLNFHPPSLSNSAGEMHQFTALLPGFSLEKTKFTFLKR